MLSGLRDKYKGGNAVARDGYNDELPLTPRAFYFYDASVACGLDAVHNAITRYAT